MLAYRCDMAMMGNNGYGLGLLASVAALVAGGGDPAAESPESVIFREVVQSGELSVEAADGQGRRSLVLDIQTLDCTVFFKTEIFPNGLGFVMRTVTWGKDPDVAKSDMIERQPDGSILLSGGDSVSGSIILRAGNQTEHLVEALKRTRKSCGPNRDIF